MGSRNSEEEERGRKKFGGGRRRNSHPNFSRFPSLFSHFLFLSFFLLLPLLPPFLLLLLLPHTFQSIPFPVLDDPSVSRVTREASFQFESIAKWVE
ncbi:hypothetical protein LguiA_031793 [Lonicera macranthoides]